MTQEPSPKQTLLLWVLLFTGEEPTVTLSKPRLNPVERAPLVSAGLIRLEKRGNKSYYVLTDKAWDWAAGHLDAVFSRSTNAATALAGLLKRLKAYLEVRELALADLLRPRPAGKPVPMSRPTAEPAAPASERLAGTTPSQDLEAAVIQAYLQASGSVWNIWVRLAEIRRRLPNVPRPELDRELLRLERAKRGVLYRIDDPQDIRPEDVAGALDVAGFKRHIFLMRG